MGGRIWDFPKSKSGLDSAESKVKKERFTKTKRLPKMLPLFSEKKEPHQCKSDASILLFGDFGVIDVCSEMLMGILMIRKQKQSLVLPSEKRPYRVDSEAAAPSGRRTSGGMGVLWRCPVVLWGPSTSNPTWAPGKTRSSKSWPIFAICM